MRQCRCNKHMLEHANEGTCLWCGYGNARDTTRVRLHQHLRLPRDLAALNVEGRRPARTAGPGTAHAHIENPDWPGHALCLAKLTGSLEGVVAAALVRVGDGAVVDRRDGHAAAHAQAPATAPNASAASTQTAPGSPGDMPTRNQISNATPRCPGTKIGTTNHQECGRLLYWRVEYKAWTCDKHGLVVEPDHQRDAAPA